MHLLKKLGLVALVSSMSFAGQANAAAFKVDPAKSEIVVQVFKEGVGAALAHDHVIRATQYTGTVEFDPANPASGSIAVEVKTGSLKADEPAVRKKFKLTSELSDKDRATVEGNMKGDGQLDTAKFPTIAFKSTDIQRQPDGKYKVTGNLTLHGRTQKVSFPATVAMEGENFHGKGSVKFKQSIFGYQPYSALLGAIKNQDDVILHLDILATP